MLKFCKNIFDREGKIKAVADIYAQVIRTNKSDQKEDICMVDNDIYSTS